MPVSLASIYRPVFYSSFLLQVGGAGRWGGRKGWVEEGGSGACGFRGGETEAESGDVEGWGLCGGAESEGEEVSWAVMLMAQGSPLLPKLDCCSGSFSQQRWWLLV